MDVLLFISFIGAASAVIATPGPNTLLMVQHSIRYGKQVVFFNSLGSAIASLILMVISLLGVHALLGTNAFKILTSIGSLYLIYIGIKTIRTESIKTPEDNHEGKIKKFSCLKESFLVGISNPKDIIFFVLFLPQFLDRNLSVLTSQTILIFIWIFFDIVIMTSYGIFASYIKNMDKRKLIYVSRIAGLIISLIGFSIIFKALLME